MWGVEKCGCWDATCSCVVASVERMQHSLLRQARRPHMPPNAAAVVPRPRQVNFFGICHDPPCIVTEYAVYGSLSELLARARTEPAVAETLTWQRRLAMVRQGGAGRDGSGGRPPSGLWVGACLSDREAQRLAR